METKIKELERLIDEGQPHLQARIACTVRVGNQQLPVHAITLGNPSPKVPAVGFFGGVHGLERVGADVVLAVGTRLQDFTTGSHSLFAKARIVGLNVNPLDATKWGSAALVAEGTGAVTRRINDVRDASGATGRSAGEVLEASNDLARQAGLLREKSTDFLKQVRAS